jgi:hypothetical protein
MAVVALGFGMTSCGSESRYYEGDDGSGGDDVDGLVDGGVCANPDLCEEAEGVTELTGADGTTTLNDPLSGQAFNVTVTDDGDPASPLEGMQVLLFSNDLDYFILAFDPDGLYGIASSGGALPAIIGDPISVDLSVAAIPVGTKMLSFSGTPPDLADRTWCGVGSCSQPCFTAELLDVRLVGLALFFDPAAGEI